MDKKTFNKITKEIFTEYGFYKKGSKFLLQLKDVSIRVTFSSWRGIKYFGYNFAINALYDDSTPIEDRFDSIVEEKLEHTPSLRGYHAHEILYEEYSEMEYKELLSKTLHVTFDPYKTNALQYLKDNMYCMCLTKRASEYLQSEIWVQQKV